MRLEPSGERLVAGPDPVGAGGGLLVAGEFVAGEVWVAGDAVVAGCGLLVAGELVAGAGEGEGAATERRAGFS